MRGYQTQRQTITQLRQRSDNNDNNDNNDDDDDDDDDGTAEFLQSNLRAHTYRRQQVNR